MSKAMTLRLPDEMHEVLRQEAFDRRVSVTSIIVERLSARHDAEVYARGFAEGKAANAKDD